MIHTITEHSVRHETDGRLIRMRSELEALTGTVGAVYPELQQQLDYVNREMTRRGIAGAVDHRRIQRRVDRPPASQLDFSDWSDVELRRRRLTLQNDVRRYGPVSHFSARSAGQQSERLTEVERIKQELEKRGFTA